MFVAASTRCFAELEIGEALHQITELEFDKVELWLDENGTLKPSFIATQPEEFQRRIREQTRLSPVALTLAHEVDSATFTALCRVAKSLRVTQIVVPSSPLGTPFNSEIERLKALVTAASADGIRVGLRTQAGRLSEDAHTAVELCQAVDKLGLAFDPSYFLNERIAESVIDLVSPHTLHVLLRDSTVDKVQVQVGLGAVDYSRLMTQLERCRYTRALSVELLPEQLELSQRPLEMRKLRMLLDSLL